MSVDREHCLGTHHHSMHVIKLGGEDFLCWGFDASDEFVEVVAQEVHDIFVSFEMGDRTLDGGAFNAGDLAVASDLLHKFNITRKEVNQPWH